MKTAKHELVLHNWIGNLTFQQQALLLTGVRGPDGNNKFNAAKNMVRYLRGAIMKPAGEWDGVNEANSFMWIEYGAGKFYYYARFFFHDHDQYPHHFIMHLVHCAEVVGYKHPDRYIRTRWKWFYMRACKEFHMLPESEVQMDSRLNDFGTS